MYIPNVKHIGAALRRRAKLWLRFRHRIEDHVLQAAFDKVIPSACKTILVHSSLSACGHIIGGAGKVITRIAERTLTTCFVTHSYCYPKNGETPVFDVTTTPSRVGAISEEFRRIPNAVRSLHPSHSIAALGPKAVYLCEGHEHCTTPCGKGTPYEKLIREEASVLMFGASMNTYTLFHTAEDAVEVPYLYHRVPLMLLARSPDGEVKRVPTHRQDMSLKRRFAQMDTFLEKVGMLARAKLGCGEIMFVANSRIAHEYVVERLRQNASFLLANEGRTNDKKEC